MPSGLVRTTCTHKTCPVAVCRAGWGVERCQCAECHGARASTACASPSPSHDTQDTQPRPSAAACDDVGDTSHLRKKQRRCFQPKMHVAGECPLRAFQLRYFTEREIGRLMGFPDEGFAFPATTTLKQQRRVLGNSLNVKVVARLMEHLLASRLTS
eukprot:m.647718 g.647718  ORF g.647718 m.647718 type:complete len:156 (+) comp22659_c0_seq3:1543-2010(+)